jgi:D-lactate dehydrogenase
MKFLVYSTRLYDEESLSSASQGRHQLHFADARLDRRTAALARDYPAICCFLDGALNASVLAELNRGETKLIALRSTEFSNVNISAAEEHGITVMRVTATPPNAVAEFAVCMMLALNRKIHRACEIVREGNFLLHGLLGFDLYGKVVGIICTGKIGVALGQILHGFDCKLLEHDVKENPDCVSLGMQYVTLGQLLSQSDIVSLRAPLTQQTHHIINANTLALRSQEPCLSIAAAAY